MGDKKMTPEEAMKQHKQFLQDILQDVLKVFASGEAGVNRMITGLHVYWDASHQRSATRRAVLAATAGTPYENKVEPMGRPFMVMIRSELHTSGFTNSDALSQQIYNEAREIALEEAQSGERNLKRREQLVASIVH